MGIDSPFPGIYYKCEDPPFEAFLGTYSLFLHRRILLHTEVSNQSLWDRLDSSRPFPQFYAIDLTKSLSPPFFSPTGYNWGVPTFFPSICAFLQSCSILRVFHATFLEPEPFSLLSSSLCLPLTSCCLIIKFPFGSPTSTGQVLIRSAPVVTPKSLYASAPPPPPLLFNPCTGTVRNPQPIDPC